MNMHGVPEGGHDGSAAGGTNCFSMGSAAVPMGTQNKHEFLRRITLARAIDRRRRRRRRALKPYPWQLRATEVESKQDAEFNSFPLLTSDDNMGPFGNSSLGRLELACEKPRARGARQWLVWR